MSGETNRTYAVFAFMNGQNFKGLLALFAGQLSGPQLDTAILG